MRQLRYAGPGEDAAHVIVESLDGSDRYTLALDDALRAAARQELPRLDRPAPAAADFSPREIQTRVRGGASAEAVAEEAGLAVERVMRFAYPVLQERARVADEARRSRARRSTPHGEMAVFGEAVDTRLAANGVEPGEVTWDSLRRPDGQWVVTAGWREGDAERFAQWGFTLGTRVISPLDDTAADLLSDRPLRPLATDEPDDADEAPTDAEDVALVGGPVGDPGLADATYPTGPIPPALRLAHPSEGAPPTGGTEDREDTGGADGEGWTAAVAHDTGRRRADLPSRGHEAFFAARAAARPRADEAAGAEVDPEELLPFAFETVAAPGPARRGRSVRASGAAAAGDAADGDAAPVAAHEESGRPGRAKIPSWDDILLGVRRRTD